MPSPGSLKETLRELIKAPLRRGLRKLAKSLDRRPLGVAAPLVRVERDFWRENGYLHFPGFFRRDQVEAVNLLVDGLWNRTLELPPVTVDIGLDSPQERRLLMREVPIEARKSPYKLNDLYLSHAEARDLGLDARLVGILHTLLGSSPMICNSLNFERGSQQDFHTDTLYMSAPCGVREDAFGCEMLATWIALEDCDMDAGPLQYYPGSHKIPAYRFSDGGYAAVGSEMEKYRAYMRSEIEKRALKPVRLAARAGDLFIWHELLFHGGSPIENPAKTRKSLVTHYWSAHDFRARHRARHGNGYYLQRSFHQPR